MEWTPTRALRRGIGVAALALLAAVASGQVALVLLAVPFVAGTALSLMARPARPPQPELTLEQPASVEGGAVNARITLAGELAAPLLCVVHAQVPGWIRLHHGAGYYASLLVPPAKPVVRLAGTAYRWGSYRLGPLSARTVACDGLLVARGEILPAVPLSVYPVAELFDSDQPLPRAAGITGIHRSRRPGDGGELSDVRPFQPGDRLRRINWRVSSRTGALHTNATWSDRDADVVLLLDVRHEAGTAGGIGGSASVLDATVRAAAAIAGHYAHQGDRVALVEFGPRLRWLRAGTGRAHYLAVLEWLAATSPVPPGTVVGGQLLTRGLQPPGALIVVLTPLLDRDGAAMLATLARAGRSLVAVDTLPAGGAPAARSEWAAAGMRLWRLERANLIGRLRGAGIPVEPWHGTGSLDLMLRHVSRIAARVRS